MDDDKKQVYQFKFYTQGYKLIFEFTDPTLCQL